MCFYLSDRSKFGRSIDRSGRSFSCRHFNAFVFGIAIDIHFSYRDSLIIWPRSNEVVHRFVHYCWKAVAEKNNIYKYIYIFQYHLFVVLAHSIYSYCCFGCRVCCEWNHASKWRFILFNHLNVRMRMQMWLFVRASRIIFSLYSIIIHSMQTLTYRKLLFFRSHLSHSLSLPLWIDFFEKLPTHDECDESGDTVLSKIYVK